MTHQYLAMTTSVEKNNIDIIKLVQHVTKKAQSSITYCVYELIPEHAFKRQYICQKTDKDGT